MKSTASPGEDHALIRAFQAGDRSAFDALVLRHKDRLFNLLYGFFGDYQEAADCAQDVFVSAFKSLQNFRFEASFSTWLYRIAVNTSRNRLKSSAFRWKRKTVPLEDPEGSGAGNPSPGIRDGAPSPADDLERKERAALIRRALRALPEDQNRVLVLRDIQGFSYEEIVEVTGLNLGTVKSRLSRARQGLRETLKGRL